MDNEVVAEGIRQFAVRAGAKLARESDLMFQATFPGEHYPAFISIEVLGFVISYATYCGVLPRTTSELLRKNWGGVEGTSFYLSVRFEDGEPWLVLETRQYIASDMSAEEVASLLGFLRIQYKQAMESLRNTGNEQTSLFKAVSEIARKLSGLAMQNDTDFFTVNFPNESVSVDIEVRLSSIGTAIFACNSIIGTITGHVDFERLLRCNETEDPELDLTWCYYSISRDPDRDLLMLTYTFSAPQDDLVVINECLSPTLRHMKKFNVASRRLAGIVPLLL